MKVPSPTWLEGGELHGRNAGGLHRPLWHMDPTPPETIVLKRIYISPKKKETVLRLKSIAVTCPSSPSLALEQMGKPTQTQKRESHSEPALRPPTQESVWGRTDGLLTCTGHSAAAEGLRVQHSLHPPQ